MHAMVGPANVPDLDVLLIEDNTPLAASVCKFLGAQGIDVDVAGSLQDGMSRIEACRVRLAMVSLGIPGGGVDACRRIRAITGRKPMVLLLSTTRATARVIKEAQAAGAEGVAQKVGGPRALLERVRRLLPGVGAAARVSRPAAASPGPGAAASNDKPRRRPAPHPHPLRAARQLPRGVSVDGKIKPNVAEALSQLKRREAQDDAWNPAGAASNDLLSDDPLFSDGGGGFPGISRAEEEFLKGQADFQAGRHEDALKRFVNAWSLEPSRPLYLSYKVRTQALLAATPPDPEGDMGDDLRMAAMLDPKLLEPRLFLGHLYLDSGRPEDARKYFKAVLDLEPGHAEAKAALAGIVNQT